MHNVMIKPVRTTTKKETSFDVHFKKCEGVTNKW